MGANSVWGVHTVFIGLAGALVGTILGAALTNYLTRRRQFSEAKRSAYTRALATLNLVRHHLRIDQEYDDRITEVREHLWASFDRTRSVEPAEAETRMRAAAADRITEMKERRDRTVDNVLHPMLEIQAEFGVFGSVPVAEALRRVTRLVEEALANENGRPDDDKFDAALLELRRRIHKELGVRSPTPT